MSEDIVIRLLNEAQTSIYYELKNENLLFDAVREIERLREQLDHFGNVLVHVFDAGHYHKDCDQCKQMEDRKFWEG